MNVSMIILIAFRAPMRNKSRAALTMLGIIIGVSTVIAQKAQLAAEREQHEQRRQERHQRRNSQQGEVAPTIKQ
ncbi:MAG: hypothetical protein M3458_07840 [Acidobacteriota bacterium]|nr:hypothetical protein [Acidobacteriota bacterium]